MLKTIKSSQGANEMSGIKIKIVIATLIVVIVAVIFAGSCRSKLTAEKVDAMMNRIASNNSPQKITFKFEMGTWGNKVICIFEDIEWTPTNKVVARSAELYVAQ
jgi:hypothetical protein